MKKFKVNCVEKTLPENLINFLESDMIGLQHCQTFYPLLKKLNTRGKKLDRLTLQNPYEILSLEHIGPEREKEDLDTDNDDNDDIITNSEKLIVHPKKRIFWGRIRNTSKKDLVEKKKVFVKITPILEPTNYLMKRDTRLNLLPNIDGMGPEQAKIQNIHNCAYVDSFAAFLMSYLVENKFCPCFPLFYGTLNGIAKKYFYDITDEYDSFRTQEWYRRGILDNRFSIQNVEWDKDERARFQSYSSMEKHSFRNFNPPNFREPIDVEQIIPDIKQVSTQNLQLDNLEDLLDQSDSNSDSDIESETLNDEFINIITQSMSEIKLHDSDKDTLEPGNDKSDTDDSVNSKRDREGECGDIDNSDVEFDKCDTSEEGENILSDVESELSVCSEELHEGGNHFIAIPEFPVQITMIEHLENTFDSLLIKDTDIVRNLQSSIFFVDQNPLQEAFNIWKKYSTMKHLETKWASYLFQICFGLAVAQKHFDFTHNDLHSNNIMFEPTDQKYLYYQIERKIYRIPTYGVILKIIDYGRAIYSVNNFQYFNDIFSYHNEAGEQYSYPFDEDGLMDEEVKPNPSFDLSRLGVSILDDMYPIPQEDSSLYQLIRGWTLDHKGRYVGRFDDFELYKQIARYVHHAIPIEQLRKDIFQQFTFSRKDVSDTDWIYKY